MALPALPNIAPGEDTIFSTLHSRLVSDESDATAIRPVNKFHEDAELTLSVEGEAPDLTFSVKKRLVLGRKSPEALGPLVDLTKLGGFGGGVSRQHAILRRTSNGYLLVKDLHSKNGTFINGGQLQPFRNYLLDHGDELRLGELKLRVTFDPAPTDG